MSSKSVSDAVAALRQLLHRALATPLSEAPPMSAERADELVAYVAAGRSRR